MVANCNLAQSAEQLFVPQPDNARAFYLSLKCGAIYWIQWGRA